MPWRSARILESASDHCSTAPLTEPASDPWAITPNTRAADDRRWLADELAATLAQIGAIDRFASFGLPPPVDELLAQAEYGPIASFNISSYRSDALLLTRDGITSVELPGLTRHTTADQVNVFH